jgi:hypothetical protein
VVEIKEGRNHEASSQTSSATIPGLGCAHAPADGSLEGWDDGVIKDRDLKYHCTLRMSDVLKEKQFVGY